MELGEDESRPKKAGTIRRITVENFMCHSNLCIELIDRVNFITGQNGSGKSAILTALCVAFGIKARGTQRANSIKDFVKNGCRSGSVVVELNNEGEDAFKPDIYGTTIFVERRITEDRSNFLIKDSKGRKVATKKEEVLEIVEHFNIDVENPCVIMTQDKSREFLHGGNDKEKFKFFFKATLLQQVREVLERWAQSLQGALDIVGDLLDELRPMQEELKQVEEQVKNLEQLEEISEQLENLKKILAWSWVREDEQLLIDEEKNLEKLRTRIPICQRKITESEEAVNTLKESQAAKKALIDRMIQDTQHLKQSQDELRRSLSQASSQKAEVEENVSRTKRSLEQLMTRLHTLEQDVLEMHQRLFQDTQAEENLRLQEIQQLENNLAISTEELRRFQEEESVFEADLEKLNYQKMALVKEMEEKQALLRDKNTYVRDLESQQTNQVVAFGGRDILRLLQVIEENYRSFTKPPLGPIGASVALLDKKWSDAVEVATKYLLDSFIVTNHKDMLLLRRMANQVRCSNLNIVVMDFDRPRIRPSPEDLPDSRLTTVMSALQTNNGTIMNVLIDQGGVERVVLAEDYESAKCVAFEGGSRNVKEVITKDGTRLYSKGGGETTLFRDRRARPGRLGVRVDEQILQAQSDVNELKLHLVSTENRKRAIEDESRKLQSEYDSCKRRKVDSARALRRQEIMLKDLKDAIMSDTQKKDDSHVEELQQEILRTRELIESKQDTLHKLEIKQNDVRENYLAAKLRLEDLCESAKGDFESLGRAEQEVITLQEELRDAEQQVVHYQSIMQRKAVSPIAQKQLEIEDLRKKVEEDTRKASIICPREEAELLDNSGETPQQIFPQMKRLEERVRREAREGDSLEVLKKKGMKLRKRLHTKERIFSSLQEKLDVLKGRLDVRNKKFATHATELRRELTWKFGEHLRRKGFSGHVNVDYVEKTLTLNVKMPQDSSNTSVRDTRALSGGERSYSTLAFALAVHAMTEAPFRAMDEFDVFMDAVSRKISLEAVVEFALEQGSQWIFITPHDIREVKNGPYVKKQQMSAPRP